MSNETLTVSEYRYNILERLARLSPVKRLQVKQIVKLKSSISESTLQRVLYQKMNEQRKTNYDVLKSFAHVLGCTIEDLEND